MRKLLSTLFFAVTLITGLPVGTVFAQDGPPTVRNHRGGRGGHARRGHRFRRMAEALNLSDAQRAQLRALRQQARGEGGGRMDRSARHAFREQLRQMLTPEQQAQMAEMRQGQRGQGHGGQRLDGRIAQMTEQLALNPRQVQQVRGILGHSAQQRRALIEQARLDGTSPRDAMRAVREQTQASLRSVLDAEQQAALDTMRSERRQRGGRAGRGGGRRHHGGGRGGPGGSSL